MDSAGEIVEEKLRWISRPLPVPTSMLPTFEIRREQARLMVRSEISGSLVSH
jgi:hypothetical protein